VNLSRAGFASELERLYVPAISHLTAPLQTHRVSPYSRQPTRPYKVRAQSIPFAAFRVSGSTAFGVQPFVLANGLLLTADGYKTPVAMSREYAAHTAVTMAIAIKTQKPASLPPFSSPPTSRL
jgi:hypothetical protein